MVCARVYKKMAADNVEVLDLNQLRNLVRGHTDQHLNKSALYWADKICTLSGNDSQDVMWLANCMFFNKQFHRTIHLLKETQLVNRSLEARYLTARCYESLHLWNEVLETLENTELMSSWRSTLTQSENINENKTKSGICLTLGKAYDALDLSFREAAIESYKDALRHDIFCYEAFDGLVSHFALSPNEEKEFIDSLISTCSHSPAEINMVRYLYTSKSQKYSKPCEHTNTANNGNALDRNADSIVCVATRHFNTGHFKTAYELTSSVLEQDPFHDSCLPLQISCLYELKIKPELYKLSKSLVDVYPTQPLSWYSVGVYYLLIGKSNTARQYFSKSIGLQQSYAPAWLGFAHSFANDGEHERAIPAYNTASVLMPGSHLPLLCLGLEHMIICKENLAKGYFKQALAISPDDPLLKHELGMLQYNNGNYEEAQRLFKEALQKLETSDKDQISDMWEPVLNNMGHVERQLSNYDRSLYYHKRALYFCPNNASTYTCLGLVCFLQKHYNETVKYLNNALRYNQEDPLCLLLLNLTLEKIACQGRSLGSLPQNSSNIELQDIISTKETSNTSENDEMSIDDTL